MNTKLSKQKLQGWRRFLPILKVCILQSAFIGLFLFFAAFVLKPVVPRELIYVALIFIPFIFFAMGTTYYMIGAMHNEFGFSKSVAKCFQTALANFVILFTLFAIAKFWKPEFIPWIYILIVSLAFPTLQLLLANYAGPGIISKYNTKT